MLALLTVAVVLVTEVRVLEAVAAFVRSARCLGRSRCGRRTTQLQNRSFDQLVEFASIQPHASAGRAVVDFDPLAIGHHEINALADRAEHGGHPEWTGDAEACAGALMEFLAADDPALVVWVPSLETRQAGSRPQLSGICASPRPSCRSIQQLVDPNGVRAIGLFVDAQSLVSSAANRAAACKRVRSPPTRWAHKISPVALHRKSPVTACPVLAPGHSGHVKTDIQFGS